MPDPQDYCQQVLKGDTEVSLWAAEGPTEVTNDLLPTLSFLGQHCPHTHITGICVKNEGREGNSEPGAGREGNAEPGTGPKESPGNLEPEAKA